MFAIVAWNPLQGLSGHSVSPQPSHNWVKDEGLCRYFVSRDHGSHGAGNNRLAPLFLLRMIVRVFNLAYMHASDKQTIIFCNSYNILPELEKN